ncbi:hypothetical protein [Streptomyces sp. Ncost-T10-10d]|uniref:hypothetical protein n=1 Tax=Streptomyces sp. Ncost-T10-10d TaxID=1839774 RepID=UPI00081E71FC|nr:hypothetical protein [Streptomyces sp. Ncost-T10-10d]SCF95411.1 hypothetical protein GA0115254_126737 [Streptomyces sp. Ncost-T10-10d]
MTEVRCPLTQGLPADGSVLDGVGLVRADNLADGLAVRDVSQDREQVVVGEAPGRGRQAEGLIDSAVAQDGGQLDRAGHLGADTDRPDGSGLLEPAPGPGADAHGRDPRFRAGPQPRLVEAAAVRVVGVVRVDDLRSTRI